MGDWLCIQKPFKSPGLRVATGFFLKVGLLWVSSKMLGRSLGTSTGAGKICLAVGGAMGCRWVTRGRLLKG